MPLPINVEPYVLNGVIGGDNYLTHYKATGADGEEFIITEFYPTYMVKREDDGTLGISERFAKEFLADLEEFVRRAEGFREIRDVSLRPVVDIFERNHTAYLVRRPCVLTSIDQFMGSQTMDFDEAYYFIRPLILSLAKSHDKGMIFNVNFQGFRANSFKQLVLCAPPSWDSNFHPTLIQIAKLYYRLVTGVEAPEQGAPDFSAYGIEMPARIEALIMEILSGDILYGSLNDFYKKFKSLIDGTTKADQNAEKKTLSVMKGIVAALFVLFALSLTMLVFGAVRTYQAKHFWANPALFAESEAAPPPAYDFSATTLTHPRNSADALRGSFAEFDGFFFFRGENGMKSRFLGDVVFIPGAAGVFALADNRLIVPDAVPSFIVGYRPEHGDSTLYFVDSAAGGFIFSATLAGGDLTRVTNHPALNLAVIDNFLFFTKADRNHYLYRLNLLTNVQDRVLSRPVYETLAEGSYLFYIAGEEGTDDAALYMWNLDDVRHIRIATNVRGGMRAFGDVLFYIDTDKRVRSVSFDGRPISTHSPDNVRTFDVYFQWLIFTEEGRHVPRAYNMDTGRFATLSSTEWVSYIWAFDNIIYALDHRNPQIVRKFSYPARGEMQ